MGIGPFAASKKLPDGIHAKLPKQQLSAEERLRRLEEATRSCASSYQEFQPAKALLQAAKTAGIAERTLHWAKDVLGVTTEHTGWHGQWVWQPPIGQSVPQPATLER